MTDQLPQRHLDRLDIEEVLIRYTRAIDTGPGTTWTRCSCPDAEIDYTESGGIAATYDVIKPWLAENLPIFPQRMHSLAQVAITVEGDEAQVAAYFHNPMMLPDAGTARRAGRVRRHLPPHDGAHRRTAGAVAGCTRRSSGAEACDSGLLTASAWSPALLR